MCEIQSQKSLMDGTEPTLPLGTVPGAQGNILLIISFKVRKNIIIMNI